jgi:hypothetical protein
MTSELTVNMSAKVLTTVDPCLTCTATVQAPVELTPIANWMV